MTIELTSSLKEKLRAFSETRMRLGRTLKDPATIPSWGKTSRVVVESVSWKLIRHGAGGEFVEIDGKRIVDFSCFSEDPTRFTTYESANYFRSLGIEGRKVLRTCGLPEEPFLEALKILFPLLADVGFLHFDGESAWSIVHEPSIGPSVEPLE